MARVKTTNGAGAYSSTGNKLVDLFFNIGASRNNIDGAVKNFNEAFEKDALKATAILLWARDIRGDGAGERGVFRAILKDMALTGKMYTQAVISLIPELGRFDDFKSLFGTSYEGRAVAIWAQAIKEKNVLAAKWADRSDKPLQISLGLNEAGLRKLLSSIRKEFLVETKMCNKDFGSIDYSKLPSVAGMRYAKAFGRQDGVRYGEFLTSKETKVNASAAFPHDVYRMYKAGQIEAASKFWECLPELDMNGSILPMVDVSGSMTCIASGSVSCLDVSISLGVYLAQRCKGPFQNTLLTFSASPELVTLPKTNDIGELFKFTSRINWDMNTNIQKAYQLVLDKAKSVNARQDELPEYILILSDMQMDKCTNLENSRGSRGITPTIHEDMNEKFATAGYKLPKIIFWNLNAEYGNFPSSSFAGDTALVSGFSPNVLKAVLKCEDVTITPEGIMNDAITPFIEMLK